MDRKFTLSDKNSMNPIVLIPSRLASTRLPNKPLLDLHGLPMIVQVMKRAESAMVGPVVVACADKEIKLAVEKAGGNAVLTDPDHPSGSDRIFEALKIIDPQSAFNFIINIQGDLPTLEPDLPQKSLNLLKNSAVDIGTLASPIFNDKELEDPNIVKVLVSEEKGGISGKAIDFTRSDKYDNHILKWHHIGLYTYRPETLEKFVSLPQSQSEISSKLEQLRALDAGMRIDVAFVDTVPLGVDTPADLEKAREELQIYGKRIN